MFTPEPDLQFRVYVQSKQSQFLLSSYFHHHLFSQVVPLACGSLNKAFSVSLFPCSSDSMYFLGGKKRKKRITNRSHSVCFQLGLFFLLQDFSSFFFPVFLLQAPMKFYCSPMVLSVAKRSQCFTECQCGKKSVNRHDR